MRRYPEETKATPLFSEAGFQIGTFGALEYSNRWAKAWMQQVVEVCACTLKHRPPHTHSPPTNPHTPPSHPTPHPQGLDFAGAPPHEPGSFPPLNAGVTPLRPDQVLPMLLQLPACPHCPGGMTASPWNGWGAYPVVTAFMVPMAGAFAGLDPTIPLGDSSPRFSCPLLIKRLPHPPPTLRRGGRGGGPGVGRLHEPGRL